MDEKRRLLRHFLAALAYRTQKALRGAGPEFASFRAAPGVRTPHELLRHMTSVLGYARTRFTGGRYWPHILPTVQEEMDRFHEMVESLSDHIDRSEFCEITPEQLLQGPLADAMTHAGQIAMLRRMAGSPIPPENFIEARIDSTNLSQDQPEPVSPDDEWFPAEEEPR